MIFVSPGPAASPELVSQLLVSSLNLNFADISDRMTASLVLFGEILPRLGCVNIVLAGDQLEEVEVEVAGDTLTLGRTVFRVSGYQFDEKISGLSRSDQFLTFRLKLLNCDKLPGLLHPREQQIFRKFQFPAPRLELNVDYELECECGSRLGGISPNRILPLPSGSWKSNSLDWEGSFSHFYFITNRPDGVDI